MTTNKKRHPGRHGIKSYRHIANLAYTITHERKKPFHYKTLFLEITKNEKPNGYSDNTRLHEEFRNYIDYHDKLRFYRLGHGYYTLTEWISPNLLIQRFPVVSHEISLQTLSKAHIETGNRMLYMKNKYNDPPNIRNDKVWKGEKNQHATIELFNKIYGQYIEGAKNNYKEYDEWDFIFKIDNDHQNIKIRFDVKTNSSHAGYNALYVEKYRIQRDWSDVYLSVRSNGNVHILGYVLKEDIDKAIESTTNYIFCENVWHDFRFLETYLNHLIAGYDISTILQNGHPWEVTLWKRQ